jgi:hypothetical protein
VTGKPVIGQVGPIKFLVENGQPTALRKSSDEAENDNQHESQNGSQNLGSIELTKEEFELIDRVEVEFYYQ